MNSDTGIYLNKNLSFIFADLELYSCLFAFVRFGWTKHLLVSLSYFHILSPAKKPFSVKRTKDRLQITLSLASAPKRSPITSERLTKGGNKFSLVFCKWVSNSSSSHSQTLSEGTNDIKRINKQHAFQ